MKRYNIHVEAKPKTSPVKVNTSIEQFGKAIVEYQGIAKFEENGKEFKVNITMYNTTCSMMIQMLAGGNIKPTDLVPELGGTTVSEFFTKKFIVPMVDQMANEDPNLGTKWLEKIDKLKNRNT